MDYLKFLRKELEVNVFRRNTNKILIQFPELKEWLIKNPQKVVQYSDNWQQILMVCEYFKLNLKPNLYIRELPIKIHTKFIESNKGILSNGQNIMSYLLPKLFSTYDKRSLRF